MESSDFILVKVFRVVSQRRGSTQSPVVSLGNFANVELLGHISPGGPRDKSAGLQVMCGGQLTRKGNSRCLQWVKSVSNTNKGVTKPSSRQRSGIGCLFHWRYLSVCSSLVHVCSIIRGTMFRKLSETYVHGPVPQLCVVTNFEGNCLHVENK